MDSAQIKTRRDTITEAGNTDIQSAEDQLGCMKLTEPDATKTGAAGVKAEADPDHVSAAEEHNE